MPKKKTKKKTKGNPDRKRSKRGKGAAKKKKAAAKKKSTKKKVKSSNRKRPGHGKNKDPIDWLLGWRYVSETIPTPTYKQVSEFLNCSIRQVEEHGSKEEWQRKLKEIDAEAADQLKQAASTSIARIKLESLEMVSKLKGLGALKVADSKDWKPKDVIAFVNAELKLLGEPDLRIDNVSDREAIKEEFREAIQNGEFDVEKFRAIARRRRVSSRNS